MIIKLAKQAQKYRRFSEALYPALADDPYYQAMEKSVSASGDARAAMLAYYDYSIAEAARYGRISTASAAGEDRVGISVWSLPLTREAATEKAARKASILCSQMGSSSLGIYDQINANMSASTGPLVKQSDWYLSILGILPAYQGQGRGMDLMAPVLDEADRAGVASYLETYVPRNMSFYEKLGYCTQGEFFEPVTGKLYWVMRREARHLDEKKM